MSSRIATLQDVADRSGVSRGTASRALTGGGRVSADTRARVITAAAALNYSTNSGARNLRRARAGSIGLWLPPDTTFMDYYMQFAFGVAQSTQERELTVSLIPTDFPAEKARGLHVDGFVMSDVDGRDRLARAILESGRPVVTSELVPPGVPLPTRTLAVDHQRAIAGILDGLHRGGARSIAMISPAIDQMWVRGVDDGAEAWSAARGVSISTYRLQSLETASQVEKVMSELFAQSPDVDAIVCLTEGLAVGILSVLRDRGLHVPTSVQLVSYTDGPMQSIVQPPISALDLRPRDAGLRAGQMLVALLEGAVPVDDHGDTIEWLDVTYRERGSTRGAARVNGSR